MARKRDGSVAESVQQIESLLHVHTSQSQQKRLQMLLLLRINPVLTIDEMAATIQCSERTVRRWWKDYQQQGLRGLLGKDYDCRRHPRPRAESERTSEPIVTPRMLKFLNSLPVTDDTVDWINGFRNGLRKMLGDVDRISVNIETESKLYVKEFNKTEFQLTQHLPDANTRKRDSKVRTRRIDNHPIGELLLMDMQHDGFPVNDYHPPHYFDYHAANGAYVGTIFLWRECGTQAISRQSLEIMKSLQPFLVFLLSDCVERRRRERLDMRLLMSIVESVSEADALTQREREVVMHHLLGKGYEQIGNDLNIGINTVRKHIKSIHRKTGTKNVTGIFARYFTPLGSSYREED